MTQYLYSGPMSGVTLPDGQEKLLHPGQPVELPADNAWVADLIFRGHLTEIKAIPSPAPPSEAAAEAPADLPESLSTSTSRKKGGN